MEKSEKFRYFKLGRVREKLTQDDVARILKVHSKSVQAWELGKQVPNAWVYEKLVRLLKIEKEMNFPTNEEFENRFAALEKKTEELSKELSKTINELRISNKILEEEINKLKESKKV